MAHTFDIDPFSHGKAQKTQKIYNKGKSTTNKHEKDTFLKKSGPQLPLAKRKTKKKTA
tara:strand:+ start:2771 stop:2944 length:174 start_codon:yes stop_codon:yes gene_type:complete